jgi:ABC-type maltose transport system permease subunit
MKRNIALQVILDTRVLLERSEQLDSQLMLIGLTVRHLCEYVVATWSSFDSEWVYHVSHDTPFNCLIHNVREDFFNNEAFHRLGDSTKSYLNAVIVAVLTEIYTVVDAVINQLNLSDYQISTLVGRQWLGRSLVLEVNA